MAAVDSQRLGARPRFASFAILLMTLGAVLAYSVLSEGALVVRTIQSRWPDLLFWSLLVVSVNLLPVRVGRLLLTFDTPVILAVALLYPPEVSALVGFVATVDMREFTRQVSFGAAVFNRLQTALAVLLAGWVFRLISGLDSPWGLMAIGTIGALAIDYLVNIGFVVLYRLQRGVPLVRALGDLKVGDPVRFLALYLSYGALALVLALLFLRVGPWATAALLIPILVARQNLIRAQELEVLTGRLQSRERLMEQLLDRMIDERKDERRRIASDLHDNVLQSLVRIWMITQTLRKDGQLAQDAQELRDLYLLSDDAIQNLRGLMREVQDSPLGRGGFLPTLDSLIRDLRLDWGIRIEFEGPARIDLPSANQVVAYQVAREALMNALKHSRGSLIRVSVRESEHYVWLLVEDDGTGFDPASVDGSKHFGLGLMRERVRHAGGGLEIHSHPGSGTRIETRLRKGHPDTNDPSA